MLPADYAAFLRYIEDMVASDQLAASEPSRQIMAFLTHQVPPGIRPNLLAFNSMLLPARVREILDLPPDNATTRLRYRAMVRMLRLADRALPGPLGQLPPYREAMARVDGRTPDVITRRVGALLSGRRSSD